MLLLLAPVKIPNLKRTFYKDALYGILSNT